MSNRPGVAADHRAEAEAVRVLATAVRAAQQELSGGRRDPARVNEVLVAVFADLAPIYWLLDAVAVAAPGGPVAAVLGHLRDALGHVVDGHKQLAVTGLLKAAALAVRLEGDRRGAAAVGPRH